MVWLAEEGDRRPAREDPARDDDSNIDGSLAVQRLAKEVAELQGVRPQERGVVFRAITRMGEELG